MPNHYDKDDPITGAIAFERVLDRLLEEAREGHAMRERRGDKDGEIREAVRLQAEAVARLDDKLREIVRLRNERDAALPALAKFYEAAEAVVEQVTTGENFVINELLAALKDAMSKARVYCDQIPF